MARVICTLPNASELINGIAFSLLDDNTGMISAEIEQDLAERFASIPGYFLAETSGRDEAAEKEKAEAKAAADAEKAAKKAEADAKKAEAAAKKDAEAKTAAEAAAKADESTQTEVF